MPLSEAEVAAKADIVALQHKDCNALSTMTVTAFAKAYVAEQEGDGEKAEKWFATALNQEAKQIAELA
tara:strand:+ start:519 stop:722 length:204 start_codon:yes stop_codon:yes gene_type:complete